MLRAAYADHEMRGQSVHRRLLQFTWQGLLLDKERGAADGAGEVVCAALLQPVAQAGQVVDVPARQHLGSL